MRLAGGVQAGAARPGLRTMSGTVQGRGRKKRICFTCERTDTGDPGFAGHRKGGVTGARRGNQGRTS